VSKTICIEVIDYDGFLALVTIPPFILSLKVGSRVVCASFMTLACTGRSPVPDPFSISVVCLFSSVEPVGIYTLLKLEVFLDMNKSLLNTFFYTDF